MSFYALIKLYQTVEMSLYDIYQDLPNLLHDLQNIRKVAYAHVVNDIRMNNKDMDEITFLFDVFCMHKDIWRYTVNRHLNRLVEAYI